MLFLSSEVHFMFYRRKLLRITVLHSLKHEPMEDVFKDPVYLAKDTLSGLQA